jgi:glycerol kinase
MLFDIHRHRWSTTLMKALNIPAAMLPEVKDCAAHFGTTDAEWFGAEIPIHSMIGDQQAALVGQACFSPGMIKSTYGTGCFAVVNTGEQPVISQHRLLTTIGYRLNGKTTYALEGSIFMAGAVVQWLRDGLGLLQRAEDSAEMAADIGYDQSEIMVPAFTGLGAPYWDPDARAAIFGMTRDTGPKQLVAAALRSVALQTQDLLMAVQQDGIAVKNMRVDGGMVRNPWFMQALADLTGVTTVVGQTSETTVQGAAMLAALQNGWFHNLTDLAELWREGGTCHPQLPAAQRTLIVNRWQAAIAKVRTQ